MILLNQFSSLAVSIFLTQPTQLIPELHIEVSGSVLPSGEITWIQVITWTWIPRITCTSSVLHCTALYCTVTPP